MLAGRSLLRRLAGLPAAARHVSATSLAAVRQQKEEPKPSLEREASDLEMLELLRYHNSTLPGLEGQVVYGKILRVERNHVLVDAGFKSCTRLNKRELQLSQLVASRDASGASLLFKSRRQFLCELSGSVLEQCGPQRTISESATYCSLSLRPCRRPTAICPSAPTARRARRSTSASNYANPCVKFLRTNPQMTK